MDTTFARTMNPDRRRLLLENAARAFATEGYERASLSRVIRACGMSKSSFYHFFGSKAALFDTVVRDATMAMAADLDAPDPETLVGPDFWDRIGRIVQRLMATSMQDAWYVDLGKLCYLPDAPLAESPATLDLQNAVTAWIEGAMAAGQRSGALRSDLPGTLMAALVFGVLQVLDRWSVEHLDDIDQVEATNLATLQIDVLHRLLSPA